MFGLQSLASLEKPGSLQAYHVTRAYLDVSVHLSDVRALLHEALGVQHVSQQAAHVVRELHSSGTSRRLQGAARRAHRLCWLGC